MSSVSAGRVWGPTAAGEASWGQSRAACASWGTPWAARAALCWTQRSRRMPLHGARRYAAQNEGAKAKRLASTISLITLVRTLSTT